VPQPTPLEVMVATLPMLTIIGLLVLAALWIWRKTKLSEMAHRERIAMIEKGLVPPPEASHLEKTLKAFGPHGDKILDPAVMATVRAPNERFRTLGVTTIGIGIGLMLLIGVAFGAQEAGIGVGGAVAAVGVAMVVNAYLGTGSSRSTPADRPEKLTLEPPPGDAPPAL
jgi:hypothetical protein